MVVLGSVRMEGASVSLIDVRDRERDRVGAEWEWDLSESTFSV